MLPEKQTRDHISPWPGIGFGCAMAMILSFQLNHSILWMILHGICSWIYVIALAGKLLSRWALEPGLTSDPNERRPRQTPGPDPPLEGNLDAPVLRGYSTKGWLLGWSCCTPVRALALEDELPALRRNVLHFTPVRDGNTLHTVGSYRGRTGLFKSLFPTRLWCSYWIAANC